jgi:hypothetical protein
MTTTQAVFFGIMIALAPSVLLALVLWLRDESGPGEENKADLQNRYSPPDLELDDQPPYPSTQ